MPGVWLGENTIPEVQETSPGIHEFGFYRNANGRIRLLVFLLMFAFATVLCGTGLVLFLGEWYPFAILAGFYLLATVLLYVAIFRSSSFVIDTNARSLSRTLYVSNCKIYTTTIELSDNDKFTIYLFPDEHGAGAEHGIYVTCNGTDRLFCRVHLDTAKPSEQLEDWVASFASALQISTVGYATRFTYLKRLVRFRW